MHGGSAGVVPVFDDFCRLNNELKNYKSSFDLVFFVQQESYIKVVTCCTIEFSTRWIEGFSLIS